MRNCVNRMVIGSMFGKLRNSAFGTNMTQKQHDCDKNKPSYPNNDCLSIKPTRLILSPVPIGVTAIVKQNLSAADPNTIKPTEKPTESIETKVPDPIDNIDKQKKSDNDSSLLRIIREEIKKLKK